MSDMNRLGWAAAALVSLLAVSAARAEDAPPVSPERRQQAPAAPRAKPKKADHKAAVAQAEPAAGEQRPTPTSPLGQVCTLSRDAVLANAAVDVSASQRLQQLRAAAQGDAAEADAGLQKDARALAEDKRSPGDEGLKKAKADLEERRRQTAQRMDLLARRLDATQKGVSAQIANAAGPIVDAVERTNGCKLLLARESVLDPVGTVDITQPIIAAMNAQLQPRPFDLVDLK